MSLTLALLALPALVVGQISIAVDLGVTYQTIDGFGFSEAFGFVYGLYDLPAAQQQTAFDYLFDKTSGAGLNIVRNRIGSDNASTIEPVSPGSPSATPSYVALPSDDSEQLWFSLIAKNNYSVSTFYADAWSAPGFMKTNDNESDGGYLCGVTGETCSSGDWRTAYANYLVQYLMDYKSAGIEVTYVGFLNEPEFTATYSSMLSDGTQAASFIEIFAPILAASGLTTKIACCDTEGYDTLQSSMWPEIVAAGVEGDLGLLTSHSYTSSPGTPINTTLHVWQTEYCDLDGTNVTAWYDDGGMGEGLTWANYIYTALVDANLSAYLYWIGIQTGDSDAGLMFIENNEAIPTGKLWAFGQWSRYVQPGAVRLGTAGGGGSTSVLVSAFQNTDGSVAVQVLNNGDTAETISISFDGLSPTAVTAYYSDNSNNNIDTMTATISAGVVSGSAAARSMNTFLVTGSATTVTSTSAASTSTSGACSALYGQCGGDYWSGPLCCTYPSVCVYQSDYYSQCLDE